MVDSIINMGEGKKAYILSPIVRNRKGEHKKELDKLIKMGFQRIKINSTLYDIDEIPKIDKNVNNTLEVVVDRIIIKESLSQRISESMETALDLSDGLVNVENLNDNKTTTFSSKFACPVSGFTIE